MLNQKKKNASKDILLTIDKVNQILNCNVLALYFLSVTILLWFCGRMPCSLELKYLGVVHYNVSK